MRSNHNNKRRNSSSPRRSKQQHQQQVLLTSFVASSSNTNNSGGGGGGGAFSETGGGRAGPSAVRSNSSTKRLRRSVEGGSSFGTCPLCASSIPLHQLERHAAVCDGGKKKKAAAEPSAPAENNNSLRVLPPAAAGGQKVIRTTASLSSSRNSSSFGICPVCSVSFPLHQLERHAAACEGKPDVPAAAAVALLKENSDYSTGIIRCTASSEPIPGLFLFEDFISPEEEERIVAELDGRDGDHRLDDEFLPWKVGTFNGAHLGKRWGVHCNLRDRRVGAAENPLPHFVAAVLLPKLKDLRPMAGCTPNEANAIDYRRKERHHLTAHVDDRQLSKEPIANLSLVGDCVMTYRNVAPNRNSAVPVQRVLLRRRCLQVLTGKARYDFSHCIENADLLSDRRISVTMRESPLTSNGGNTATASLMQQQAGPRSAEEWWKKAPPAAPAKFRGEAIEPTSEPIPGLFVFDEFITEAEEVEILRELDDPSSVPPWKAERHTGSHNEKRYGVDHDLWSQNVRSPKYNMPTFLHTIIISKLRRVSAMMGCNPNDANALDYRRKLGHSLKAHVDDRKKHKEPISNLSLAGDCLMTFRNEQTHRNLAVPSQKVLLKRRCLQVLTGKARYDFSHGIDNCDLLSDRRVSFTMRETPY